LNLQPGATNPTQQIHVKNSGTLPVSIEMLVKKLTDADNSCTEPELVAEPNCVADLDGEVDEVMVLNLDGYVNVGPVLGGLAVGGSALANGPAQSGADSIFTLAPGADKWVSVDYEIPLTADNTIQTDSVSFEVVFNASQI
jgi:hypothetical protein